jgi:hypothetical protein
VIKHDTTSISMLTGDRVEDGDAACELDLCFGLRVWDAWGTPIQQSSNGCLQLKSLAGNLNLATPLTNTLMSGVESEVRWAYNANTRETKRISTWVVRTYNEHDSFM